MMSFEEALQKLETSVQQLESGDLSLEQALETFEQGVKMSRLCSQKLEESEKKVELLLAVEDNKPQTALFDMDSLNE
jgi:exodeoxyribonuclease VII small subunit